MFPILLIICKKLITYLLFIFKYCNLFIKFNDGYQIALLNLFYSKSWFISFKESLFLEIVPSFQRFSKAKSQ